MIQSTQDISTTVVAGSGGGRDVLQAMASLAGESRSVIHVVVPRGPGVVHFARELAEERGLSIEADLMAATIRIRFDGSLIG